MDLLRIIAVRTGCGLLLLLAGLALTFCLTPVAPGGIADTIADIIAGAGVVETGVSRPGPGTLARHATLARDTPTIMGIVFTSSLVAIAFNILADATLRLVDPGTRAGQAMADVTPPPTDQPIAETRLAGVSTGHGNGQNRRARLRLKGEPPDPVSLPCGWRFASRCHAVPQPLAGRTGNRRTGNRRTACLGV